LHWRVARKRLARRDPNRKIIIHISAAHITARTRALAPRETPPFYRGFHPDTAGGFPAVSIRASFFEREAGAANLHFSCPRF